MLLWLSEIFAEYYSGFNVFQYLTLRTILGMLTALFISLLVGPKLIRYLNHYQIGQNVRDDGPQSHHIKSGTPTMGGLLILLSIMVGTLCWADVANRFIVAAILVTLAFGFLGWVDDYRKLVRKDTRGLSARYKYFWQTVIGLVAAVYLYRMAITVGSPAETQLLIPFVKSIHLELGWFYIVVAYFVIVGSSNAVNLTDGLDGLAILPTVLIAGALAIFAYVSGHVYFANYLGIPYILGVGELAIFCGSIAGAGLGFLWFNTYPAEVFMGDVGALSLGAALGIVAVMVRQELIFLIIAGAFVVETGSVILQVGSYKMTGRRIFHMAPLHHHYELKGLPEPKIIVRFWIITAILVLIGLASLKIR